MSDYLVHGKKGNGKSLVVVGRIRDALAAGKKVATNLDLKLEHLLPLGCRRVMCYRLPDRPSIEDMQAIGEGSPDVDEDTYGLIVLDEMATWMNARTFADKGRQALLDWFVHSRKLGWDVYFICQSPAQIDKQVRESLVELSVSCKRLDKIRIPFLGSISKHLLGIEIRPPKIHVATIRYGMGNEAVVNDRWTYTGRSLYHGYDTRQIFKDNYSDGLFSYLSPWHIKGYAENIPLRLSQRVKAFFTPLPRRVATVKPLNRYAALIMRLPVDQRIAHFQKFQAAGVL